MIALESLLGPVDRRPPRSGYLGRSASPSYEPLPGINPSLTFKHSVNCRDQRSRRRSFVMADFQRSSGQGPELQFGNPRTGLQKTTGIPFSAPKCVECIAGAHVYGLSSDLPIHAYAQALIDVIASLLQGFLCAHHRGLCGWQPKRLFSSTVLYSLKGKTGRLAGTWGATIWSPLSDRCPV